MRNRHNKPTGPDIIQIENATFHYDDKPIFKDIHLETAAGELFCIMGCNGCGKSTLLDCILGNHILGRGTILVSGKEVSGYRPAELAKKISYVPQIHEKSFPYLVRQIVLMGRTAHLGGYGKPDELDEDISEQSMKDAGIAHLADRPYTQISGGEMQMVALARALAQKTPIILMDEPTAHLDFFNEMLFLEKTVGLVNTGNRTILMATHSPNQAFYLENQGVKVRVALMHEGAIFSVGSPDEVLTEENLAKVYGVKVRILRDENRKQIVPVGTI
ncbi:ABC transporter ATP-binding protein [Parasporobacterium paucivorans]|uniref:Iron complex transport system ATP-binding protein n=1 Tax=Parasporobacterium paucivorans DSM 15970 TaxID=1122934 RepID=A0A1M6K762_9FIRM|nr:ABC transporter ATP-binding protein [Parasporobacterium paucivorans]SHJ54707.1 iron complex transport system ATP-binding protein [Parasporobacterium paucivorans DSM 15970]